MLVFPASQILRITICKVVRIDKAPAPGYPTDVHLRGLGVLVPENYVEDDLERDSIAAGVGSYMAVALDL